MLQRILIFTVGLLLCSGIVAQERLKSGLIQVAGFPANNGDGTFTLTGTFSDPTGLTFASDIAPGFMVSKGNDFFIVTAASNIGPTITLTIDDTYNVGFIAGGTYTVAELTANLNLPGVGPTGDSNASLTTPPDYASKINLILQRIDAQIGSPISFPLYKNDIEAAAGGIEINKQYRVDVGNTRGAPLGTIVTRIQ